MNSRLNCHNFLKSKREKLIPQPIYDNKILFHLVIKDNYYKKQVMKNISKYLEELKEYSVTNDILELHMPKIHYVPD